MTPEQFVYWMQGFAELNESPPSPEQWQSIREHLQLVFKKETPKIIFGLPASDYDRMRRKESLEANGLGVFPVLKC